MVAASLPCTWLRRAKARTPSALSFGPLAAKISHFERVNHSLKTQFHTLPSFTSKSCWVRNKTPKDNLLLTNSIVHQTKQLILLGPIWDVISIVVNRHGPDSQAFHWGNLWGLATVLGGGFSVSRAQQFYESTQKRVLGNLQIHNISFPSRMYIYIPTSCRNVLHLCVSFGKKVTINFKLCCWAGWCHCNCLTFFNFGDFLRNQSTHLSEYSANSSWRAGFTWDFLSATQLLMKVAKRWRYSLVHVWLVKNICWTH